MLEMATNNPCALPNSNPCGCWRWRRTVRETPVLADAGDGDEKSVRFVELQSLRMLETTKDGPCNSGPRGCWRWRGTIHTPCRTPLLAALEIATSSPCKIILTRRHSGCCYLDLPLMSSAMFEAAFASQQLSHRRATDFRKKTLSTTFSFLTFSLKILPGLAAMQPFLLRCLSLQALRRGAGRRRKGLVFRKILHFWENTK